MHLDYGFGVAKKSTGRAGRTAPKGRPTRRRDGRQTAGVSPTLQWFVAALVAIVVLVVLFRVFGVGGFGDDNSGFGIVLTGWFGHGGGPRNWL